MDSKEKRRAAYSASKLPYCFSYKIRQAFTGRKCPLCGSVMQIDREFGIRNRIPTIQHNIPIVKGGKHELGNISVICKECNITIKDGVTEKLNADEVAIIWNEIVKKGVQRCRKKNIITG